VTRRAPDLAPFVLPTRVGLSLNLQVPAIVPMKVFSVASMICLLLGCSFAPVHAANDPAKGTASGLPVPRFVSLKAAKVNMHVGPGKQYEVTWLYQRAGLPVEITAEFENWRRIRDGDGTEGWVYHSLLSGRRTGVVSTKNKDNLVPLRVSSTATSGLTAKLQPGVVAAVKQCNGDWCHVSGENFDGWIEQTHLWGVYPNEKVD
jgi:SH3-like domain-containing protein